jgi:hypothetical protein
VIIKLNSYLNCILSSYHLQASTGSSVLIQNKKTSSAEFHSAIVSDVNEGLYDVIFDDDALGEEESIDISRVVLLASVCNGDSRGQCTDGIQVIIQHFTLKTSHILFCTFSSFFMLYLILYSLYFTVYDFVLHTLLCTSCFTRL